MRRTSHGASWLVLFAALLGADLAAAGVVARAERERVEQNESFTLELTVE